MSICIQGYDQPGNCDHCGKHLIHGVRTNSHGVIGADCFVKLIKADRKRFNGNGKPSASMVRDYDKLRERCSDARLSEMGYNPMRSFTFELAE